MVPWGLVPPGLPFATNSVYYFFGQNFSEQLAQVQQAEDPISTFGEVAHTVSSVTEVQLSLGQCAAKCEVAGMFV